MQFLGTMTLDRNPTNYFAETEQVAFNPSNLVPGIDVTNDPLLQARLFSYLDTQITRLGGPNWNQIPINRAHAPINDKLRDGFHQDAVHGGVAPYRPNSLDGGCPFVAGVRRRSRSSTSRCRSGRGVEGAGQPGDIRRPLQPGRAVLPVLEPVEQDHVVDAYTFELSKCWDQVVRERQLRALANIDPDLCRRVADGLGLPGAEAVRAADRDVDQRRLSASWAGSWPVTGRQVGIVVGPGPRHRHRRDAPHGARRGRGGAAGDRSPWRCDRRCHHAALVRGGGVG